jgi:Trk K+ transport system NAD-binding subunit
MKLVVVGTGHVGLVTAATLAAIRHDVVGLDEDEENDARNVYEPERMARSGFIYLGTGRTPTHGPV